MRKVISIISFLILLSSFLHCEEIWIYADDGTWEDGIVALEQFLNHYGIAHKRIYSADLNEANDYSYADAICFPGGFAYNYKLALTNKAIDNLRKYVANGGNYLGICAGAYFACSNVVWEGEEYTYQLALFEGSAVGSIYNIAKWDNYAITNISLNKKNPILKVPNSKIATLYYGGPYFESKVTNFDTIASWDDFNDLPAIINFNYQKGRVLLIGPHLEIEEDSDRDSTIFAQELDDIESDWEVLANLIQWLIRKQTDISENNKINIIYPNPATDYIYININDLEGYNPHPDNRRLGDVKVYNTLGECVITTPSLRDTPLEKVNLRIDVSHLPPGVYFVRVGSHAEKFVKW